MGVKENKKNIQTMERNISGNREGLSAMKIVQETFEVPPN